MLHYILHYGKTESDAFLIYVLCPSKFTKSTEKFTHVFWCNPASCVPDLHMQHFRFLAVAFKDLNRAFTREFQSILYEIN